jgi:alkylation response protein AidB-like acyl-CoA dehydrogenase
VSLDLELDPAQRAVGDALAAFCRERCPDARVRALAGGFPHELWRELAALGVLALATPDGDGGALEAVAALEALGGALFPGPLAATFFATQLLPEAEREAVASGDAVVALGAPPLLPFAPVARVFIEVEGARAWLARPAGPIEPVDTLGGEPWGRVALARGRELGETDRAHALHDLALAAYAAAAAQRLVDDTAEHARTRRQFGRALGEFQAVAHPLADCAMAVAAARGLARAAAFRFDRSDEPEARELAAAARLSAQHAGLMTAHSCHQLFGAIGVTLEGPVFHVSRRLRQLASQPPGDGPARQALLAAFGVAEERAA